MQENDIFLLCIAMQFDLCLTNDASITKHTNFNLQKGKVCNEGTFCILLYYTNINTYQHFKSIFFLASNYFKGENENSWHLNQVNIPKIWKI